MNIVRYRRLLHLLVLLAMTSTLLAWAGTAEARSASLTQAMTTIDPSDLRLVPNPIESSDEGTAWTCQVTGSEVQCTGTLRISWELQEAPDQFCAVPLYSVNGTFSREQTRYYTYDAASNSLNAGASNVVPSQQFPGWQELRQQWEQQGFFPVFPGA